jgi:DNA-binding sugar fermentation-stimulating protein
LSDPQSVKKAAISLPEMQNREYKFCLCSSDRVSMVVNVKLPKSNRKWLLHLDDPEALKGILTFGASISMSRANLRNQRQSIKESW